MPAPWLSWTRTLSCKSDSKDVIVCDPKQSSHRFPSGSSAAAAASSKIQPASPIPFPPQAPTTTTAAAATAKKLNKHSSSSNFSSASLIRSSCNCSLANLRDVVHGNTRVMHRASTNSSASPSRSSKDASNSFDFLQEVSQEALFLEPELRSASPVKSPHSQEQAPLLIARSSHQNPHRTSYSKKFGGSCNGCGVLETMDSMVPFRESSRIQAPSNSIPQLSCQKCGECFSRIDALEHHHTIQHAVSELGRGDSSRNIIEIIFRSSWITTGSSIGRIERVLKVHSSQRTISRFEDYRDMVKSRANSSSKKNARCIADGNELLRFFGSSVSCALGASGSTSLCSLPSCAICKIIRHGFTLKANNRGIQTTATSSNAHSEENFTNGISGKRAMIVCRVIAGRSYRSSSSSSSVSSCSSSNGGPEIPGGPPNGYDSVVTGIGSDGGNLIVFNPRAVLPCFVVIYKC